MNTTKIESPRIKKLYEDVKINKEESLQAFWSEIAKKSAPLIEEIEGDDENYLVTLLWKETEPIDNVSVIGEMFGMDPDIAKLEKLIGTDLWYRTWKVNGGARSLYVFVFNIEDDQDWDSFDFILDPLNPRKYVCVTDDKKPNECYLLSKEESYIALNDFKESTWVIEKEDTPKGKVELFDEFKSNILNNKRRVWMYTPAGYNKNSEPCGLAIFTDGWEYAYVTKTITILDNLINEGKIPAICVVFIETDEERDTELTCSDKFGEFIKDEILPWVYMNYNVTRDPQKTLIGGFSYGGLTASFLGLKYPDIFQKVLCQSGGMSWTSENDGSKRGKILEMYENADKLPLDFYITFGEFEKSFEGHYNATKEFVNILEEKGYKFKYKEFMGGHNNPDLDMELANGFKFLLGNNNSI
jgi:enterochelin esterase-like enzyme